MKRFFISMFILLMITGLSVFCLKGLEEDCEMLTDRLTELGAAAMKGEFPEDELAGFRSMWDDFSFKSTFQLNSESLDDITSQIDKIELLFRKEPEDAAEEIAAVKSEICHLCDRQKPKLRSIF